MKKAFLFFGLIFLIFGFLLIGILSYDQYHLIPIHLFLGIAFLLGYIFIASKELKKIASASATALSNSVIAILFLGVIGLSNYLIFKSNFVRFDLTRNKELTLAPQSLETLNKLSQAVEVSAFDPTDTSLSLLKKFSRENSQFQYKVFDSERSKTLVEKLQITEGNTIHLKFSDKEAKIAGDINEQELTSALIKVSQPIYKSIYLISGHGEGAGDNSKANGYSYLVRALEEEGYAVKPLLLMQEKVIPPDASALILINPQGEISVEEFNEIERFRKAGGGVLILTELSSIPFVENYLKNVGIGAGKDVVVVPELHAYEGPSLGVDVVVTQYGLTPATEGFQKNIILTTANSVIKLPDPNTVKFVTELVFSSTESWAEGDVNKVFSEEPSASKDPADLMGPVPIGAAYDKDGRVVAIGDSDFVNNLRITKPFNRDFILNVMNYLTNVNRKVTIRARTFDKQKIDLPESEQTKLFLLAVIILPEILILAGLSVWIKRSS